MRKDSSFPLSLSMKVSLGQKLLEKINKITDSSGITLSKLKNHLFGESSLIQCEFSLKSNAFHPQIIQCISFLLLLQQSVTYLGLKTTQVYYLIILEVRSPKCAGGAAFLLEALGAGGSVSLSFPVSRGCLQSSAHGLVTPTSVPVVTSPSQTLLPPFFFL